MQKYILSATALLIFLTCAAAYGTLGQKAAVTDKSNDWKWIVLLQTERDEIEAVFGKSISAEPSANFQTYVTKSFKINIAFAKGGEYISRCECYAPPNTAVSLYIAPREMLLSELDFDLRGFKKDSTFAPREITYYNVQSRTLIGTELLQEEGGSTSERVITIQIHATKPNKPD